MIRAALPFCLIGWAAAATGQALQVPAAASITTEVAAAPDQLLIAIAPMADGAMPTAIIEGTLTRSVWKITETPETTLALLLPMVLQLESDGYTKTFSCADSQCGGFDFRFAVDVLPPPDMQVNLADFQYWTGTNDTDHVVLLVSKIAQAVYIQIDRIGSTPAAAPVATQSPTIATRSTPGSLGATLEADGRAILPDLSFAPGTSSLAADSYASLSALADFLRGNPALRVALVGHTDTAGSLAANIALSKKRAQSVMARLTAAYDIPARQVAAEGMGYLAPVANNLSADGREANRRVEVIIVGRAE